MATIVTRSGKGSPLTHAEVDANFTNLNTDKLELSGGTMTGNLSFGDNDKAIFGAGSDLQIYHNAFNSIIQDSGTGNLYLGGDNLLLTNAALSETYLEAVTNGEVNIRYDGSTKLATTSSGVDITGTLTSDGLTVDGGIDAESLTIENVAPSIYLRETDTTDVNTRFRNNSGSFNIQTSNDANSSNISRLSINHNTGDLSLYEDTGTTPKLQWSASNERLFLSGPDYQFGIGQGANQPWYHRAVSDGGYRLHLNGSGDVITASNTGNVGIGTSSPIYNLDVGSGSGSSSINIFSGSTDTSAVYFTDNNTGVGSYIGRLAYNHTADAMLFTTNASERMRIDSSGNLLVGRTSTAFSGTGHIVQSNGIVYHMVDGAAAQYLRRNTSDGDIVRFYKDSTTVGSIGVESSVGLSLKATGSSGYISFLANNQTTGIFFDDVTTKRLAPYSSRDNEFDLGDSDRRWKDLYLSGGVYLGGTGSANHLDDYEEGTFTPTFVGSTGGTVTLGSPFDKYAYTKIGRIVTITGRVDVSGTPSLSGNLLLQGLPFTSGNLTDQAGYTVQYGFITIGASNTGNPIVIELQEGTTEAALRLEDWTTASGVLVNNSRIQMSITYFTS